MSDTIRLRPYRDYRAPLPLGQRWEDYWRQCWERAGLQLKTIMEKKNAERHESTLHALRGASSDPGREDVEGPV